MLQNLRRISAFLAVLLPLMFVSPVHAQDSTASDAPAKVELPNPLTPEAVDALVSRLSDEQVRTMLLERLDAVAAEQSNAPPPPPSAAMFAADVAMKTADMVRERIEHTPAAIAAEAEVIGDVAERLGARGFWVFLGVLALAVVIGAIAELIVHRFVIRVRLPEKGSTPEARDVFEALPILARRLVRDFAGLIVFFIVGHLVIRYMMPPQDAELTHIVWRFLIVMPRIGNAILRFFLAPRRADLRLVNCDDTTAWRLFRNFFGIVTLLGVAFTLFGLNQIRGNAQQANEIGFLINASIFAWLGFTVWRARTGLTQMMLGRRAAAHTPTEIEVARWYPWYALWAIAVIFLLSLILGAMGQAELLRGGNHFISLAVLLIAPLLDSLIFALVARFMPPMRGEGRVAERAYQSNLRAYIRMGRVALFGAVLLITARLWDVSLTSMASSGVGEKFAAHLIQAMMICVVGYYVWEIVRLLINRKLSSEHTGTEGVTDTDGDAPHVGGQPSSRLGTILPPVSWALQTVIIVMTVLTALGNLGINVTPLLAGAGIAGIAIGFGAQKLVTDVMSGLFFLVDDAFRLNEYVDLGGQQGTVEKISLRSITLRDAKGPVLCIPYSNINQVTNFGRDWGIMKLRFTVPFGTDTEKVRKIFKRIGEEMMQMPDLAPGFIEPFKGQGVAEFTDYGIVVRGKFMHKPGTQFGIRKYIFKRVQEEFEKNGIEFARREVKVNIVGPHDNLTEDQKHQIAGAAAETVAQQQRDAAALAAKGAT